MYFSYLLITFTLQSLSVASKIQVLPQGIHSEAPVHSSHSKFKETSATARAAHPGAADLKGSCAPDPLPVPDYADYQTCAETVKESIFHAHPDQFKTTPEIIETYGYSYKVYSVHTQDGYILKVFRITGSPHLNLNEQHQTPVYVNHGLTGESDSWFIMPPKKSIVFKLVDNGFDVWIGNTRGTMYSLEHETLDSNSTVDISYWDFSFHQMGVYDVPAVTNKILTESGHHKILYLGYSMGTTQLLISLAEHHEMNDKIKAAFLMAPLAFMGHCSNIMHAAAVYLDTDEAYHFITRALGGHIRNSPELRSMFGAHANDFCVVSTAKCGLCGNVWFALLGFNAPQLDRDTLPLAIEKLSSFSSYRVYSHFAQLMTSCRFQKYQYTKHPRPPSYELQNIRSNIYMYHGEQDNFGVLMDVQETARHINKSIVQRVYMVKDDLFNHLDFLIAKDADKLVYDEVIKDMKKYRRFKHAQ